MHQRSMGNPEGILLIASPALLVELSHVHSANGLLCAGLVLPMPPVRHSAQSCIALKAMDTPAQEENIHHRQRQSKQSHSQQDRQERERELRF
jgi:hypothetical protein